MEHFTQALLILSRVVDEVRPGGEACGPDEGVRLLGPNDRAGGSQKTCGDATDR